MKKRVLIAAANADACRILSGFIDDNLYEVSTATDGMTVRNIDVSDFSVIFHTNASRMKSCFHCSIFLLHLHAFLLRADEKTRYNAKRQRFCSAKSLFFPADCLAFLCGIGYDML